MSFDVVFIGEANDGKTTIVSSLIEDENARIGPIPGTTKDACCYRLNAWDGTAILRAWDTPGFEETDDVHAWFVEHARQHAGKAVDAFILEHQSQLEWESDIALLKPIREGALVVYVVASNRKPQSSDRKQLEIIRLAGAHRIALINTKSGQDYSSDWTDLLKQEVGIIRKYSPLCAGIEERLHLLSKLADCSEENRVPIMLAHAKLKADWEERLGQLARLMLGTIAKAVTTSVSDTTKAGASEKLTKALKALEERFRSDAKNLFRHRNLNFQSDFFDFPITSSEFWQSNMLGMTRKNASIYGGVIGAAIGLMVDAPVGGMAFGIPTLTGGIIGATAAQAFAFIPITYKKYGDTHYGAKLELKSQAINVLLDRMVLFARCLLQVSHGARPEKAIRLELPSGKETKADGVSLTNTWDLSMMRAWDSLLKGMLKGKALGTLEAERPEAFERILLSLLDGLKCRA
jgi:GTP-binding protein EngB required for normal cell division